MKDSISFQISTKSVISEEWVRNLLRPQSFDPDHKQKVKEKRKIIEDIMSK